MKWLICFHYFSYNYKVNLVCKINLINQVYNYNTNIIQLHTYLKIIYIIYIAFFIWFYFLSINLHFFNRNLGCFQTVSAVISSCAHNGYLILVSKLSTISSEIKIDQIITHQSNNNDITHSDFMLRLCFKSDEYAAHNSHIRKIIKFAKAIIATLHGQ